MTSSVFSFDHHFSTEELNSDLKGRSVRGGMATFIGQAILFILQLGSTAVLARLLLPADFGLIAMVYALVNFMLLFKDAGLSVATVQQAEINHYQVSTLFWINVALSIILMTVTAALAPVVTWFYGDPRLTDITIALAISFVFTGLTVQHQALLRRKMRFGAIAAIEIASLLVGIAAAIILAMLGTGYWALVAMNVTSSFSEMVIVWIVCDWRPGIPIRGTGIRSMLAFGGNLTVARILQYFTRNLDNILIGKIWGAGSLGFYIKAYRLLMMPILKINAPLSNVALPVLSRLQKDPERFRRFYRQGIAFCVTLGMPCVIFTFVVANNLILFVFGSQWTPAIPIFRALAPAAFIGTFSFATSWVLIPLGRADKELYASLFGSALTVVAFFVGVKWGVIGVAIAFSSATFVKRLPQIMYAFHGTPLSLADLGSSLWRPALASITAGAIVAWMKIGAHVSYLFVNLVMDLIFFIACYFILWMILPGGRGFLLNMIGTAKLIRSGN